MKKNPVLLVEDDFNLAETIKDILETANLPSIYIHSDDIDMINDITIDPSTVIIDFYHHAEIYADIMYVLKRKYKNARFILLTGKGYLSEEILKEISDDLGVDQVIKKPFSTDSFLEKIINISQPVVIER
ncbi:MAG: hypothetical protein ACOCXD_02800 [Bacteroidota bacterium]